MAYTKNRKILFAPMLLVIILLVAGYAYADWTQIIYIDGTAETSNFCFDIEPWSFMCKDVGDDWTCDPYTMNNVGPLDKDVGSTTGDLVDTDGDLHLDTLELIVENAYPCYYNEISIIVRNWGTVPLVIQELIIEWEGTEISFPLDTVVVLLKDGKEILEMKWLNGIDVQLDEGGSRELSFKLHVLQEAEPDTTYTFIIRIPAIQWNKA
jgi:hypothetical protein